MLKSNIKVSRKKLVFIQFTGLKLLFAVFLTILAILLLPKGVRAQSVGPDFNCNTGFEQVFDGITYRKFTSSSPRTLTWYVVKVDLNNPNIDLAVTPRAGLGTTTSEFLSTYGAEVAINGDLHWNLYDPAGLAASQGDQYSDPSPEPSLFISEENEVRFWNRGNLPLWDAISGSNAIVRGGNIAQNYITCDPSRPQDCIHLHPRTSVGLTNDNTLILMVVDGRQPGHSEGVTIRELAYMMRNCGARDAINMDGGGSSTLVFSGQGVINQPSDGTERAVSNHLGVCVGGCLLAPETRPYCTVVDVRTNPGDNLFAGTLTADLSYTANFSCQFLYSATPGNLCRGLAAKEGIEANCYGAGYYCAVNYGQVDCQTGEICGSNCVPVPSESQSADCKAAIEFLYGRTDGGCYPNSWGCAIRENEPCPSGYQCGADCRGRLGTLNPYESCVVNPYVQVNTIVKTPLARQIWQKLVAGATAVFRKFPPKIEPATNSPIQYLNEIPAVSPVNYTSLDGSTIVAGSPALGRPGSEAEIYFPYIGGLHQYFLQCVQTLLRPKGYGPVCPKGTPPTIPTAGVGTCQVANTQYCSVEYLQNTFGSAATTASQICRLESGGNPTAINTNCLNGTTYDYSVGLFQYNLVPIPRYDSNGNLIELVDSRCPGAFVTDITRVQPPFCLIANQEILNECVQRYLDPDTNIQRAWELSRNGTYWCHWAYAAETCGIQDCL